MASCWTVSYIDPRSSDRPSPSVSASISRFSGSTIQGLCTSSRDACLVPPKGGFHPASQSVQHEPYASVLRWCVMLQGWSSFWSVGYEICRSRESFCAWSQDGLENERFHRCWFQLFSNWNGWPVLNWWVFTLAMRRLRNNWRRRKTYEKLVLSIPRRKCIFPLKSLFLLSWKKSFAKCSAVISIHL